MDKVIVVKIGGSILGRHDTTIEDLVELQHQGWPLVIVHGGGKLITKWLEKQGISSQFVQGERATDKAALEVVVAVLAGIVNKEIVAAINSQGGRAVGISGVDGGLIHGEVKSKELGYVGSVAKVDLSLLEDLLESGYIPVVAPPGLVTVDGVPQILNINADVVAGEIAAAIGAERLVFLTDVVGVCDEQGNLISRLSAGEAEDLIASGVVVEGMIPKVKACLRADSGASVSCIIDGRQAHSLIKIVGGGTGGTTIKRGKSE